MIAVRSSSALWCCVPGLLRDRRFSAQVLITKSPLYEICLILPFQAPSFTLPLLESFVTPGESTGAIQTCKHLHWQHPLLAYPACNFAISRPSKIVPLQLVRTDGICSRQKCHNDGNIAIMGKISGEKVLCVPRFRSLYQNFCNHGRRNGD